jgi:hypothetical protein
MRETGGRNAKQVEAARKFGAAGRLDIIIHNAGHMVFGPAEAFTPEQLSRHPPGQSACGSGLRNPRKLWSRRLDAGTVWINQHLNVHPNIPFSGHKTSGIGIEFGEDGLKEFCNLQVIANRR